MLEQFLNQLRQQPDSIAFSDTIAVIDTCYDYQASAFSNGSIHNLVGENQGSCKILYFAQLNELDEKHTLHCFGHYYREDVLKNPTADDHANIRAFMLTGLSGLSFEAPALTLKASA